MTLLNESTRVGLLDSAPDAMICIDESGRIVLVNAQCERLFGYDRTELLGQRVEMLVPIAEPKFLTRTTGLQLTGHRRDGTALLVEISISLMTTEVGVLTSATVRDVTERIEAEVEHVRVNIEAERVRVEAVVEKKEAERVRDVAEVDRVQAVVEKKEAERVRDVAEVDRVQAEVEKKEAERVRVEVEVDRVQAEVEKEEAERVRVEAEIDRVQAEVEKKEAERVRVEAEIDRVQAEVEKKEAERVRVEADVEHEQLKGQLHQSQRMESLGQLAGGVAHDFNNLLAVILNYASFVAEELSSAAATPEGQRWVEPLKDVEQIQVAAERASLLTHQLLSFARREVVQARALSLNVAITRMEQILRRTIGEQITLVTNLVADLPRVVADPGQIEQIILNLAINARDAMPSGGTLSIDTSVREITNGEESVAGAPAGTYVCLRVSDTGVGMAPDVREHAFEPFFTTKPRGEGSGLGLATVYGIVLQSAGYTRIYSDVGVGTSITILLPATQLDPRPGSNSQADTDSRSLEGSETILVIDDEEALREVTRRILTRNGYRVITASSGAQAIAIVESNIGGIDLVLTDVIMPIMLGPTAANRIRELRPGIRVLFMSGHAQPVLEAEAMIGTRFKLVEKPFDQNMLLGSVRAILDDDES